MLRDTYIEVDLDRLAYNVKNIRKLVGDNVAIAAVVKADAYGHGSIEVAKTIMENGGDYLAVATLVEALELRNVYDGYDIFIMGYTPDENLNYIIDNNLTQCIFSYHQALILSELGKKVGKRPRVHIKYDTGFNRLGYQDKDESVEEIKKILMLTNLDVEGIFSHFALAGEVEDKKQFDQFVSRIEQIESTGFTFKYKHICDSIAAVDYPEYHLNMVRPGAILYGLKSFKKDVLDIKQVMAFKSKVYHVKPIKEGEGISYSYNYRARRDMLVATVPFGYADGFPRNMYKVGEVTIHGKRATIVGVICMDQAMVDVTDIPDVKVGDEVIIYGDGKNNTIDIETAAQRCGTNKNEIVCRISRRTPRVYIKDGTVFKEINYLL